MGWSILITAEFYVTQLEHNGAGKLTNFQIQNILYSKRIHHYQFINQGNFFTSNCVENNEEWNALCDLR